MPVSGDPVWLEDVLRPALGDRLKTLDGWQDSGVGGVMGDIWGTVWHHTGSAKASAQSIRDGRPDLKGPLSQLHIAQDGTVTIVAVGPCNHAGKGSWVGLPTDDANTRTIGVECAYPKDATNQAEPWPDAQIIAMRDTGAALTKHLGVNVSHNISHKEWAQHGPAGWRQGKTDPWHLDMDWFRGEIQKDIDGFVFPGEPGSPPPIKRFPDDWDDRELLVEVLRQLRGPALNGWPQLGGKSLVDAVAELRSTL
ncbi:MAG: N-acetylmuramoyl-L-alanine amidase [Actinomycetia bacterium]|nr:N-acetylmuramoyl-L-alanine amidase [Actinomycetes bacterium]